MKFFVHGTDEDAATTDRVYIGTRVYLSRDMGVTLSNRRLYSIYGVLDGAGFEARVGEGFERLNEPVVAIFYDEALDLYFVCTPNRGIMRGVPYLYRGDEVKLIYDFEPED